MNRKIDIVSTDLDKLKVDSNEIISKLGSVMQEDSEYLTYVVGSVIELFSQRAGICELCNTILRVDLIDKSDGILTAESNVFNTGSVVASDLMGSEKIILCIVTAGEEAENLSAELKDAGRILESYITDVIASVFVEKTLSQFRCELESDYSDISVSNYYCPGNCGWQIEDQQTLFSIFRDYSCGVRLTEGGLMHPIKSLSAIIGLGKQVQFRENNCELCNSRNCLYRTI